MLRACMVWFMGLLAGVLSSCSILPAVTSAPVTLYTIDSVPPPYSYPNRVLKSHTTLLVLNPEAHATQMSTHIFYRGEEAHQISYFPHAEWAEAPTLMLLPLLVQTLQDTGHFKAVVSSPFLGQYQHILRTQLLELTQEKDPFTHQLQVKLRLNVQLLTAVPQKIKTLQNFTVVVPVTSLNIDATVSAINQATQQLLQNIATFCLENA